MSYNTSASNEEAEAVPEQTIPVSASDFPDDFVATAIEEKVLKDEEQEMRDEVDEHPSEVSYSGQDFDVDGLVRRLQKGHIKVPSFGVSDAEIESRGFQRNFVWCQAQMDKFIESLLLGYPVPNIFLVRQKDEHILVLDGQQRLRTLERFYEDKFALKNVSPQFKGKTYTTLDDATRRRLDDTLIQAIIVSTLPEPGETKAIYQIFERLNSGGTQLTAHEIRIAVYAGDVIEYLDKLNGYPSWRLLYSKDAEGAKHPRVKDQELVARILAMYLHWTDYSRPLKNFISSLLEENAKNLSPSLLTAGRLFEQAADLISEAAGVSALRRKSYQINTSWTDSIFVGLMTSLANGDSHDSSSVKAVLDNLADDVEFTDYVQGPTADESLVSGRMRLATKMFSRTK